MLQGLSEFLKLASRPKIVQSIGAVGIDLFKMFCLLVQSIFLIRSTGGSIYENYFLVICITSLLPQLVGPIDFAIPRFLQKLNNEHGTTLISTIIIIKFIMVGLGSSLIFLAFICTNLSEQFPSNPLLIGSMPFALILMRSALLSFTSTISAIVQSNEEYYFLNFQMLTLTLIEFTLATLAYFMFGKHSGFALIWAISIIQFSICVAQIIWTSRTLLQKRPGLYKDVFKRMWQIRYNFNTCSKLGIIAYTGPLTASGLGGYMRDFLPGMVWSQSFPSESLAAIRVWQQLTDAIGNAVPKAIRFILPSALRVRDEKGSKRFIDAFHIAYPIASCVAAFSLFLSQNLVELIWNIPELEKQNSFLALLGASLVIGCMGQIIHYHGLMGKDLRSYFYVSVSRIIFVDAFLVSLLVGSSGTVGIGMARVATAGYSFIGLYLVNMKDTNSSRFLKSRSFKMCLAIGAVLIIFSIFRS